MNPRSQVKLREQYLLITGMYRKEPAPPDEWAALSAAEMPINELAAVVHRNVAALVATQIDLPWPRNFLLRIEQHFLPLGDPA